MCIKVVLIKNVYIKVVLIKNVYKGGAYKVCIKVVLIKCV